MSASIHVLRGDPSPEPFDIKSQREALFLLAHYVGDIEQPLHVGAVSLSADGEEVDPDTGTYDPASETRGGNQVTTIRVATNRKGENFHATWDDMPEALQAGHVDDAWVGIARKVPVSRGSQQQLFLGPDGAA